MGRNAIRCGADECVGYGHAGCLGLATDSRKRITTSCQIYSTGSDPGPLRPNRSAAAGGLGGKRNQD